MGQDCDTLFFGPKKYVQDLCIIISHQKEYIQVLEGKLQTLGVDLQLPQRGQASIGVSQICVSFTGSTYLLLLGL